MNKLIPNWRNIRSGDAPWFRAFSPLLPGTLLVLLVLAAYLPALHAGFIWDDDDYVTGNSMLRSLEGLRQIWFKFGAVPQYYPLVHTTFWLEYHTWGLHPLGYHLVNILGHGMAAFLFWRVLLRLEIPGAWLAAAVFAVHPVQVESVAWVSERKNVLSAIFYFAAALSYWRYTTAQETGSRDYQRWRFYIGALVLYVAALLSKTTTCSLPAALLLLCWWKQNRLKAADIAPLLPFFVVGAVLGLMTTWIERTHVGAQGAEWTFSFADRCLIAGRALWFYASKLLLPIQLTFVYPRWQIAANVWWQWLFPTAAVGLVAGLWWLRRRFGKGPLVAVLLFAGTLAPALGFINFYPMRYSFVADHFQYLAAASLIALGAAGMARLPQIIRVLWIAILGVLTWQQANVYQNLETLWRDTLAKNPGCFLAHQNLGLLLQNEGKLVEAEKHWQKACQLRPEDGDMYYNWATLLILEGRITEAISNYYQAVRLKPGQAEIRNNLAVALHSVNRVEEAIVQYHEAIRCQPDHATAHFNLGVALEEQQKRDEAIEHYQMALRIKPDLRSARNRLRALGVSVPP